MPDIGGNTRDLLTLRAPLPAEPATGSGLPDRELTNRRYGRTCLTAGLATLTAVALIVCATPEAVLNSMQNAELQTLVGVFVGVGSALVAAGLIERLTRYSRALSRQVIDSQQQHTRNVADYVTQVGPLDERLAAIEAALDRVAAAIPHDQQLQVWRGIADAARKTFNASTGTDGPPFTSPPTNGGVIKFDRGRNPGR